MPPSSSSPAGLIVVYTDGACSGNPGPGGWAWAESPDGARWASGAEGHTTNQQMEVQAVLDALRHFSSGPIEIVSDSTYVVNCFRDHWWEGWLKRGWKNSKKEPVANQDRWRPLIDIYRDRPHEITFRWVKGHAGDPMNDLVDRLAVEAAATQRGAGTSRRPPASGPAELTDAAGAGAASAAGPEQSRLF